VVKEVKGSLRTVGVVGSNSITKKSRW